MSQNKTKRSSGSSSDMGKTFPIILLGALGIGIAYFLYQNSDQSGSSGSFGSSSGDWYDVIGGAATNSERATSPAADTAGWGAGSASAIGTGVSSLSSGSSGSSYVAEVGKKAATVQNYQAIDADFVNSINSQLMNIYGEGSAYNFAKVPSNAVAAATIQNTGINNAGKELLSIVNSDNSYQVYDSRGQIVSSGSAGAFQGSVILNTGSSGSSSGSSKKAASVSSSGSSSSGSKNTVNIISDKSSVIRSSSGSSSGSSKKAVSVSSSGSSSGKITGTATIGYSSGSSSSGSSGKKYTH